MTKGRRRPWWLDIWARHKLFIITVAFQVLLVTYMLRSSTKPPAPTKVREQSLSPHLLFIGIISDISGAPQRAAIRESWLTLHIPQKATVKYKFVIGKSACLFNNQECDRNILANEKQLIEEQEKYQDILRVNVEDGDLEAKKVWGTFKWLSDNLEFRYFVKVQHDTFLRLDLVAEELFWRPIRKEFWSGFVWRDHNLEMPPGSVLPLNYKLTKLPPFPDGESFIMSSDIVYDLAENYPAWFLPDVGQSLAFWMLPFNLTPVHEPRFQHGDFCNHAMFTKCHMTSEAIKAMYSNIQRHADICEGFNVDRCALCVDCLPEQPHWRLSGIVCNEHGARKTGENGSSPDPATENIIRFLPMLRCEPRKLEDVPLEHNLVMNGELKHTNSLEWGAYDWKFVGSAELVMKPDMGEDPLDSCIQLTGAKKVNYITQQISLDQQFPEPLVISAWSKAVDIGNVKYGDYALYADFTFNDGTHEYSFVVEFDAGTHEWQYNFRVFHPPKPISLINIFCMLRSSQGKAYFDDIFVGVLSNHMCELKHQSLYFHGFLTELLEKSSQLLPANIPIAGGALPREQTQDIMGDREGLTSDHVHVGAETATVTKSAKFFLIWTSPVETFKLRHRRAVESIFFHHPDATVHIYSNTLPLYFFHKFASAGYNINVKRYDLQSLVKGLPGAMWVKKLDMWEKSKHFYVHSADFLRFVLLYRYGGIYSDADSILLRPIDVRNVVGSEACGDTYCKSMSADTTLTSQLQYFFPIGFMAFEKNHSLLLQALSYFDTKYDLSVRQCGSIYLSLAYSKVKKEDQPNLNLKILPATSFFPILESEIPNYFEQDNEERWKSIADSAYAFHFWGTKTQELEVMEGSLMWRALNEFSISNLEDKTGIQL